QVLKKKEEEALVKRLKELDAQINEIEKNQEQSGDLREKSQALRAAKEEAEKCHKAVSEYAERAQAEHDEMIKLYEQADALRKQADEAQAKFIECKKAADEEHKKHIEQIKSFHETDKDFAAIKNKQKAVRKKKTDAESKKAADDIFARFKSGDKLSTEDLMILQKSGYL
ncbi:MAG: phosphoserine phosphatase, partial [Candidatus Methanomethylophilaceae archaeon]|nr:phosphoserine phosphatase [Candidatus Methanomethylophilaceae archaeon]